MTASPLPAPRAPPHLEGRVHAHGALAVAGAGEHLGGARLGLVRLAHVNHGWRIQVVPLKQLRSMEQLQGLIECKRSSAKGAYSCIEHQAGVNPSGQIGMPPADAASQGATRHVRRKGHSQLVAQFFFPLLFLVQLAREAGRMIQPLTELSPRSAAGSWGLASRSLDTSNEGPVGFCASAMGSK